MAVIINGTKYVGGNNIVMKNGKILIDGREANVDSKVINILVEGDVETLDVDTAEKIGITGNVQNLTTMSGDVTTKGSVGTIKTGSGNVDVEENCHGDIKTGSGNIKINGSLFGNANSGSGNIKSGKTIVAKDTNFPF